jgi:zinc and cadmium transporter
MLAGPAAGVLLHWNCNSDPVFLSFTPFLAAFTAAAAATAAAGVLLNGIRDITRRLLPASGFLLMGVALALIFPELVEHIGWASASGAFLVSLALVWVIDKFVYPVCPACSPAHDHDSCASPLHGFAGPLLMATLIHDAFDGWMLALGYAYPEAGHALSIGVIVHKIPESFAFGAILAAALKSRKTALTVAVLAQFATFAGAALYSEIVSPRLMAALLALGGGVFLYLGFHAVHGAWKRRTAAHVVRIS